MQPAKAGRLAPPSARAVVGVAPVVGILLRLLRCCDDAQERLETLQVGPRKRRGWADGGTGGGLYRLESRRSPGPRQTMASVLDMSAR
jgi:hypothetical protein